MKKTIKVSAVAAAAALMLAACGAAPDQGGNEGASGETGGAQGASNVKACMVSDEGGFDDKSFNQSGYEGLKRAEKALGVEV